MNEPTKIEVSGATPQKRSVEPLIDIVMLVHDQAAWAELAVKAVESFTKNPYRLIVVDNASVEPQTKAFLKNVEDWGHKVIRLPENKSFSNGVNVGVEAGDAKFVIILNDDAIVTEGWDGALVQDANDKFTGLVGARSNYAAGAQGDPSFQGEPPYLVFVCVAMRRAIWDIVGPLDEETFDGFSSEDLDYSWRVKKAGYKLKVSSAYVLHAGSRTLSGTLGTIEALTKNNQKYNARLIDKWGKEHVAAKTKLKENILVASFHAEEWTRVSFMGAFTGLKRSDGVSFSFFNMTRAPIHMARQAVADYALDHGFDVLVSLDDDAIFPPETVKQLVSHGKDIVTALAYQRKPPHLPCVFELGEDGMLGSPLFGLEHTGLRKVDVSGYHCSLIRTSVFKKLRDFRDEKHPNGIRQYYGGFDNKVGEDFAFSLNAKKVGVQIYCDTELISGHIGAATVVDETFMREWYSKNPHP